MANVELSNERNVTKKDVQKNEVSCQAHTQAVSITLPCTDWPMTQEHRELDRNVETIGQVCKHRGSNSGQNRTQHIPATVKSWCLGAGAHKTHGEKEPRGPHMRVPQIYLPKWPVKEQSEPAR